MASEDDGESPAEDRGVQLVVQRCNKAQLLVDNQDEWVEIGTGLVVYVSFAKVSVRFQGWTPDYLVFVCSSLTPPGK